MKKNYGKFDKKPKVKDVLLQTYFTSLLCLVLCVTMFFGTSFAWFTSEVNNVGNEVYIGTLDVDLFKVTGNTEMDMSRSDVKLFDNKIRWEPGYTALETIRIENAGDLAFKYVLNFTDGKLADQASTVDNQTAAATAVKIEDVAKYFEVWVYDHNAAGPDEETFAAIQAEGSGWDYAGTLDELLTGKSVLSGEIEYGEKSLTPSESTATETTKTHTIALHMKETATNETVNDMNTLMGRKISLNVKLVAYQMASEKDDLGSTYDRFVSTSKELQNAFQSSGNVILASNIQLDGTTLTVPENVSVILDLNGYKITDTIDAPASLITNNGNLVINGGNGSAIEIKFEGTVNNSKAVNAISNNGSLTVNGGKISNTSSASGSQIGYAIDNYTGATLVVNGGEITASGSSYYDGIRLFCGSSETVVTVNGGTISTIWAQNPSDGKATEVKGTVIVNGGVITTVYYENYTTVKIKESVTTTVTPYGAGSDTTKNTVSDGYTVYSFNH